MTRDLRLRLAMVLFWAAVALAVGYAVVLAFGGATGLTG